MIKRFFPAQIAADHEMSHIKAVSFADARAIADDVIARFEAGEFDVAHLFYARFQSALVQEPVGKQIIPVAIDTTVAPISDGGAAVEYRSPTRKRSSPTCSRATSRSRCSAPLLENAASEQGSRMTAMDNATRNRGRHDQPPDDPV